MGGAGGNGLGMPGGVTGQMGAVGDGGVAPGATPTWAAGGLNSKNSMQDWTKSLGPDAWGAIRDTVGNAANDGGVLKSALAGKATGLPSTPPNLGFPGGPPPGVSGPAMGVDERRADAGIPGAAPGVPFDPTAAGKAAGADFTARAAAEAAAAAAAVPAAAVATPEAAAKPTDPNEQVFVYTQPSWGWNDSWQQNGPTPYQDAGVYSAKGALPDAEALKTFGRGWGPALFGSGQAQQATKGSYGATAGGLKPGETVSKELLDSVPHMSKALYTSNMAAYGNPYGPAADARNHQYYDYLLRQQGIEGPQSYYPMMNVPG